MSPGGFGKASSREAEPPLRLGGHAANTAQSRPKRTLEGRAPSRPRIRWLETAATACSGGPVARMSADR